MTFKEKQKYFEDGLKEAEQLLTAKLKKILTAVIRLFKILAGNMR